MKPLALLASLALFPAFAQTPYQKWLDEDVAYLTRDDERAAFLKLQTDPEREQFIHQFWLRRDPSSGTPRNEFKEEHYRRISYANERYACGVPGWKSHRGRVYIILGPPDEVESHPSGDNNTPPYEIWRYRSVEGLGPNVALKFVDPTRTGEFPLALALLLRLGETRVSTPADQR